jgi:hypothetical protein
MKLLSHKILIHYRNSKQEVAKHEVGARGASKRQVWGFLLREWKVSWNICKKN